MLALGFAAACTTTETETEVQHVYDPYEGEAYPNRRPKLTPPAGDLGLTSDNASDTVTVLDLVNRSVLGAAPVGRSPVDIDGPHHLAGDRAKGLVYVALSYPAPAFAPGPHAAHGSSTRDGFVQRLALDDLRVLGEVRVDPNPGDIVLSEDGGRIAVTHFDLKKALGTGDLESKRATLAIVDPTAILATGSPPARKIPVCVAPHGVAFSRPAGDLAFVACYGEDAIAIVDVTAEPAVIERIEVGPGAGPPGAPAYGPYSAVLSPDGARVALGCTESKDVRLFDVATKTMEPLVVTTLGAPYFAAWTPAGDKLYVPTQQPDALVVADAATGAELQSTFFDAATCVRPHEVVLGTGGAALYVLCEGDHVGPGAVLVLDPTTLEVQASLPVGAYPDRLAILPEP